MEVLSQVKDNILNRVGSFKELKEGDEAAAAEAVVESAAVIDASALLDHGSISFAARTVASSAEFLRIKGGPYERKVPAITKADMPQTGRGNAAVGKHVEIRGDTLSVDGKEIDVEWGSGPYRAEHSNCAGGLVEVDDNGVYGKVTLENWSFECPARRGEVERVSLDEQLEAAVLHSLDSWGCSPPGMLLRVTGHVRDVKTSDMDATEQFEEIERMADLVFEAANKAGAWLFTTGMERSGSAAALMGRAQKRNQYMSSCPLIGVANWLLVEQHEQIIRDQNGTGPAPGPGTKRMYREPNPDQLVETLPVQPEHTMFIFFGGAAFAEEAQLAGSAEERATAYRAELSKAYPESRDPTLLPAIELMQALEEKLTSISRHEAGGAGGGGDGGDGDGDGGGKNKAKELLKTVRDTTPLAQVPRVLLVIGGGEETLEEVVQFLVSDVAGGMVVVEPASGGLAEELCEYMKDVDSSRLDVTPLGAAVVAAFAKAGLDRVLKNHDGGAAPAGKGAAGGKERRPTATPNWRPDGKKQIVWDSKGVSDALIRAVLLQAGDGDEGLKARLHTAVTWNDARRMQNELQELPVWHPERADVLGQMLQVALNLGHVECARVALESSAPAKAIKLLPLYDQLFDTQSPPEFYLFEGKRTELTQRAIEAKTGIRPPNAVMVGEPPHMKRLKDSVIGEYYPRDVWVLLQQTVPGLCKYWETKAAKHERRMAASRESAMRGKGLTAEEQASLRAKRAALGVRAIDLYVWAVLLGNTEMALMLLPFTQEPIRAAIIGARLCQYMASKLPLDAIKLMEHATAHEHFATTLLDLCSSFNDARRMLRTKSQDWNRTVVQLATQSNLQNFCAHRYCQTLADEMLRGNIGEGVSTVLENRLTSNAGVTGAVQILAHALVPVPLPGIFLVNDENKHHSKIALGWLKHQTLFVTAEELEEAKGKSIHWLEFYRIALVRQLLRLFFYFLFMLLYSYIIIQPKVWPVEGHGGESMGPVYALGLWCIALALDEWYKYAQDPSTFDFSFWVKYDYTVIVLTLSSLAVFVLHAPHLAMEIMKPATILVWCRMLKFLQLSKEIGVLVIMIMAMFENIALWGLVSSVFTAAFMVAFLGEADAPAKEVMTMPLWAMLGAYDQVEAATWSPTMGQPMLWLYVVISNVVLVNLLIAMMGDTYGKISEKADQEWKIGRLRSVLEAENLMHPVPPPLSLPLMLPKFIKAAMKGHWWHIVEERTPEEEELEAAKWKVGGEMWLRKRHKDRIAKSLLARYEGMRKQEAAEAEDKQAAKFAELERSVKEALDEQMKEVNGALSKLARGLELQVTGKAPSKGMLSFRGNTP